MSIRDHYRKITCALCALVSALAVAAVELPTGMDGPLLDLLVKTREWIFPLRKSSRPSPVVVIALDKRSLKEPEIAAYPRAFLAPVWAETLDAVFNAGARAVGFDILFSYSANRFISNFDLPFLRTLDTHRERVVLGRSASTLPARSFLASLRNDPGAMGLVELNADADGIYRKVHAEYRTGSDETLTGFAAALLRRAGASPMPQEVILAPERHLEKITTYALTDVLRCARTAPEALREHLGDRIVLIGGNLAEEDRKITSGRYLTPAMGDSEDIHPCGLKPLGASLPESRSVPAVFIHAAAVKAVMDGRLLTVAPKMIVAILAAATACGGVILGLFLTPWVVVGAIVAGVVLMMGMGTMLLANDLWLPLAIPLLAWIASPSIAYTTRYLVVERARKRIEHAFGHFVSPSIVARIESDPFALKLGGQARDISVMFADLSGFTKLSTRVPPEILMSITNRYLSYIVDAVESTGGYVDKFIGDAVMAIWGAPAADDCHAQHAIRSALDAVNRILRERKAAEAKGEMSFSIKVGINSGRALVGNVGTEKRYRYTAVGETVNIASRLEGLPALYGCHIIVGPETARLADNEFFTRELDTVRVKDVETPLRVFEPLVERDKASSDQGEQVRRYGDALGHYRSRNFTQAVSIWMELAQVESQFLTNQGSSTNPPALMAERAKALLDSPPDDSWDGVWTRTEK